MQTQTHNLSCNNSIDPKDIPVESFEFPYHHSKGFSLDKMEFRCNDCGNSYENIHGGVKEYAACFEILVGGTCHNCKKSTTARFRHYGDRVLIWTKNGFVEMTPRIPWYKKLFNWLENI
jgi:hypothetical protein